jgi:hypothetical protein
MCVTFHTRTLDVPALSGLTSGTGFFVGMTAGLTFGMPATITPLTAGNKAPLSDKLFLVPIGQYPTRHSSSHRAPDVRDRGRGYVESKATMEKAFAEAIERNRSRLKAQREELRRTAAVRRRQSDSKCF